MTERGTRIDDMKRKQTGFISGENPLLSGTVTPRSLSLSVTDPVTSHHVFASRGRVRPCNHHNIADEVFASRLLKLTTKKASKDRMLWIQLQVEHKEDRSHELLLSMYRQHGFIVQYFDWRSGLYLLICDIDDCVSEQICVNNEFDSDDFDVLLLMSLLTIDDCIFEEISSSTTSSPCDHKLQGS